MSLKNIYMKWLIEVFNAHFLNRAKKISKKQVSEVMAETTADGDPESNNKQKALWDIR